MASCARGAAAVAAAAEPLRRTDTFYAWSCMTTAIVTCDVPEERATPEQSLLLCSVRSARPALQRAGCWGRLRCESLGCELGELRAARCQLRFHVGGGSAWSQGAQRRRHAAAREVPRSSVVLTAAVEQVVPCAGRTVFPRGGVALLSSLLFISSTPLHQRARAATATPLSLGTPAARADLCSLHPASAVV